MTAAASTANMPHGTPTRACSGSDQFNIAVVLILMFASLHDGPEGDSYAAAHSAAIDVGPQAHVFVDRNDDAVAGPPLKGVRNRPAGARVFMPRLAKLPAERTAATCFELYSAFAGGAGRASCTPAPALENPDGIADLRAEMRIHPGMETGAATAWSSTISRPHPDSHCKPLFGLCPTSALSASHPPPWPVVHTDEYRNRRIRVHRRGL